MLNFQKVSSIMNSYINNQVILGDTVQWPNNGVESLQIEGGRHEFPFRFQLPSTSLPTSHEIENAGRNRIGYIRYSIKATLLRSWNLLNERNASTTFIVEDIVYVNRPNPQSIWRQRRGCCSCFSSGPISVSVTTDKGGYLPFELLTLNVKVENNGNRRITGVLASLIKRVTYYGKTEDCRMSPGNFFNSTVLRTVEGLGAKPGGQINWTDSMYIPRVTPTTLDNCRIITVSYQLSVKVVIAWAKNIIINVPIVIGNAPVQLTETSTNASQFPQPTNHCHTANPLYSNANTRQPTAANPGYGSLQDPASTFWGPDGNPGFIQLDTVRNTRQRSSARFMSLRHPENTNQPPATNPEFMLEQPAGISSFTNPDTYPPVNTEDASQQVRDSHSAPVTNYNDEQPPSYDSIFNT